jgi:hypothetical protein
LSEGVLKISQPRRLNSGSISFQHLKKLASYQMSHNKLPEPTPQAGFTRLPAPNAGT